MPLIFGRVLASGIMVPVNVDADGDLQIDILAALPAGTNLLGDVQARNKGWIAGAWQKDPLRLGYSGDKTEQIFIANAAAGLNFLTASAVPAGEIWEVQAVAVSDTNNAGGRIEIFAQVNGIGVCLATNIAPVAGNWTSWTGKVVLSAGDNILGIVVNAVLNDDLYLRYHAVRVDIDQ